MRTIAGITLRSISNSISSRSHFVKLLSTSAPSGDSIDNEESSNSFESNDKFEQRIFGDFSGDNPASKLFYQKLDGLQDALNRPSYHRMNRGITSGLDGLDESLNTLSDGMDGKLKKAATYFEFDPEEIDREDYAFRPDMNFWPEGTYEVKDLDLTKPAVRRPRKRHEFKVTTKEVLRNADFRNVRFLANFITEAGIMHKRSKFGISAKAQRKLAREIKTARAFGLMPFTTMGTKSFVFGKTMEDLDQDYEHEVYSVGTADDAIENLET